MESDKAIAELVVKALEEKYKNEINVIKQLLSIPNLGDVISISHYTNIKSYSKNIWRVQRR